MPEYTYQCYKERGGCNNVFTAFFTITNYQDKTTCPNCNKIEFVGRDYKADLPQTSIIKSNNEIKVGHLAKRNTEHLSKDEKAHLYQKHNKYKYEEPKKELPTGMTRLGPPNKRDVPQKQRKRDPKRKNK